MRHRVLPAAWLVAIVLVALVDPARASAAEMPRWMTYDAATKAVKMTVISGENPSVNNGWNYNGYASGNLTITVPLGSRVEIDFKNVDQLQHSLVVVDGQAPLPPQGGEPAFRRAYTIDLVQGIPRGGGDTIRFTADKAGRYRIMCGVVGHALAGMEVHHGAGRHGHQPGAQGDRPERDDNDPLLGRDVALPPDGSHQGERGPVGAHRRVRHDTPADVRDPERRDHRPRGRRWQLHDVGRLVIVVGRVHVLSSNGSQPASAPGRHSRPSALRGRRPLQPVAAHLCSGLRCRLPC